MRDRDKARGRQLRTELAETAARLLAEGSASGFHAARMKAAERLGVADVRCHPSNQEIEAALAAYQRLFQADRHDTLVRGLRQTAVEAMDWLAEFQPRLVGPVLSGTASVTTPVTLHVFADEAAVVTAFVAWLRRMAPGGTVIVNVADRGGAAVATALADTDVRVVATAVVDAPPSASRVRTSRFRRRGRAACTASPAHTMRSTRSCRGPPSNR